MTFVQDNHSRSVKNVLRGLHYQIQQPQGKLIRVVQGDVFDVAVDIRQSSPTFGQWVGEILSAENKRQMWVPEGFAHGFVVLSDSAECLYKTTGYYAPEHERCISWNDQTIGIQCPRWRSRTLYAETVNSIQPRRRVRSSRQRPAANPLPKRFRMTRTNHSPLNTYQGTNPHAA